MESWFTSIEERLIAKIKEADQVLICCPWVTSTSILDALLTISNSKILITDWSRLRDDHLLGNQLKETSEVRVYSGTLMHSKFLVLLRQPVDSDEYQPYAVIVGSYNLTISATQNIENMLWVPDDRIAKDHQDQFYRLYRQGVDFI
jgi:HKD family nuclease